MNASKSSAESLLAFFDYLIGKGLMNKETAASRRVATTKIIDILDEAEKGDLSTIDRDQVFNRFVNLRGKDYSPQSLSVYKSRFGAALDDFLAWTSDPVGFRPSVATKGTKQQKRIEPRERSAPENRGDKAGQARTEAAGARPESNVQNSGEHLTIPIPLRRGLVVKVHGLPLDLTQDEARKIGAVINAYAVTIGEEQDTL